VHSSAFFLKATPGQRLCVYHPPQANACRGMVLYLHPFAEEMNKARRMAALQARALAQAGYAVLQLDLLGCGDSSGDFGDASWQAWIDDAVLAAGWLRQQLRATGHAALPPLWLWGLRAGCLLAAATAARLEGGCNFLFWQPASSGKALLQQFLRLKAAGSMLDGKASDILAGVRQQLAQGQSVEIAGYLLSAALSEGLEQATLAAPAAQAGANRLEIFELSQREDAQLSPASATLATRWREQGFAVNGQVVSGPAFWQTTEIEDAPALLAATVTAMAPAA
jgi:exosortase A-associated hydrolase 2